MKSIASIFVIAFLIGSLASCGSVKPYYGEGIFAPATSSSQGDADIAYTLFMVGGVSLAETSPVLNAIQAQSTKNNGLVLLGDVISLEDLPSDAMDEVSPDHAIMQKLKDLSSHFKDFYIVPGDREWKNGRSVSSINLQSLDKLLKDVKDKGRLILPAKDCAVPEVVRLSDNVVVVLMDSQWAIEAESHPGDNLPGCELNNVLELRTVLKDIIQSYPADHILFLSHHPIYANGPTAGNYPLSSHLLPLPVVGSLITGVKTLFGSNQHFGHPAYEAYRAAFKTALDGCKNCTVISGHEESLQYYYRGGKDYLVAGSGHRVSHARKGESSRFSFMSPGFVRADALSNGQLRIAFYAVQNGLTSLVWQKDVVNTRSTQPVEELVSKNSLQPGQDSIVLPGSTRYKEKHFLRGEFYRASWSAPLKMKVLYLDKEFGGLQPLQLGGGNQTRSLRLTNEKGEQYVLRSIDKKVTAVLPPALRGSFAENIVQDGIAASHPYGALVIPELALAAGVYYTNPSIVYVPYQDALGIYNDEIGDGVYLFEERPGGKTASFDNFGNTTKTYSTADVIELLQESSKFKIDQEAVLRARLFDIWLGDWDRHDDQWRWAAFEEKGVTILRPIPRDRDQVFYKNDGVLDYLASRPYFNPPLRKFTEEIDHLDGLIWAGKYFDRSFLHELTEDDFIAIAQVMQQNLTDDVIERAFLDWPKEIDELDGARIRTFLRERRNDLAEYAREFYNLISKEVFIPATADKDIIAINLTDDDRLDVTVTRTTDNTIHYRRIFDDSVTKELRVFGLNKKDSLVVTGTGDPSIKIRFVGGTGEDVVVNPSKNFSLLAYDSPDGMTIRGKAKPRLNERPLNNTYDRTDWNLNRDFHFIIPTYYTDEGLGINYSYWWTRYGFRSDPFKSKHAAGLSYFFGTGSFIGKYDGQWLRALGEFDLGLNLFFSGPTFIQYFYGLGNEYVNFDEKKKYHIVSGSRIDVAPSINKRFGLGNTISLTPMYQFINVEDENEDPRFIYTPESGLSSDDFGRRHYAGIKASYRFSRIDNAGHPTRGVELGGWIGGRTSITGESIQHGLIGMDASLYLPFNATGSIVLATHLGADKILGEFEFFHALTLGGPFHLRGYRTDRFGGESRYYHATDLRIKLLNKRGVVPFELGVYGAFDYGRVWYDEDGEDDDAWHTAIGGGLFIVPLGFTSFRLGYMVGEEDKQLTIGGALRF